MKLFALLALLVGCVNISASDDVSITKSLDFPFPSGLSVSTPTTTVKTSASADVSKTVKSLKDLGDITLTFPDNTLSGENFSWLKNVQVSIVPTDNSLPEVVLTNYNSSSNSDTVSLPVELDSNTLFQYLSEGAVNFNFTLTGSVPTSGAVLTWTLTTHAVVAVNKSL